MTPQDVGAIVQAVQRRTDELTRAALRCADRDWAIPAGLPEWSRLTILCHVRYGASMTSRMTRATLDGQPTTFYPEGRATQRPQTLRPAPGESPRQVVESLVEQSVELAGVWARISPDQWEWPVVEARAADEPSRMPLTIADLALLRLTEVEVHGTDLGIGLSDWSPEFVDVALPRRIAWLGTRTRPTLHESADLPMTWLLAATDGPSYAIRIDQDRHTTAGRSDFDAAAHQRIEGPSRDLLALILGRPASRELHAPSSALSSFQQTFPGP